MTEHDVHLGAWVGVGVAVGGIFGIVAENIPLGVKIGAAAGFMVGYLLRWRSEHRPVTFAAQPLRPFPHRGPTPQCGSS